MPVLDLCQLVCATVCLCVSRGSKVAAGTTDIYVLVVLWISSKSIHTSRVNAGMESVLPKVVTFHLNVPFYATLTLAFCIRIG